MLQNRKIDACISALDMAEEVSMNLAGVLCTDVRTKPRAFVSEQNSTSATGRRALQYLCACTRQRDATVTLFPHSLPHAM